MQDKGAAGLPIKSFANTMIILIQLKTLIHIRIIKLVAVDVKIWIKTLSLKGFCQLIPFCKTVTQMNGLNMMWIQIKTTAVGDILNFLLYHRAVGSSGPIPPPSRFWQEWKENLSLHKALNCVMYFHPPQKKFRPSGGPAA